MRSISDILYKSSHFKVSITLFCNDDNKNESNLKYKRNNLITVSKNKNTNEINSIYLDSYARAVIGLDNTSPNLTGETLYFSQKSFYELDMALSVCLEWLRSKNFKYLFDISSEGIVTGLGGAAPYHPSIHKNQTEFIRFFPALVRDSNNVSYEGIAIRNQKGPFAQFVCAEFFVIASSIKNYIANCYGNNMQLINLGFNIMNSFKSK